PPSPSSASTAPSSPSTGSTSAGTGAPAPAVGPGAPAATASTPAPVVPAPTAGRGAVTTVGDLVPGRSGYLSVTVTNPGTQAAAQTIALHLPSGVSFDPG